VEKTLFFDGIEYSANDMITYLGSITTDGVVKGKLGQLAVSVSGSTVTVSSGFAFLSGRLYTSDANTTLTLDSTTTSRTDAVVLKLDVLAKTFAPIIKKSATTAGSNELLLATIALTGSSATVTDKRTYATLSLDYASTRIDRKIVTIPAGTYNINDVIYTYSIPYAGFSIIKVRVMAGEMSHSGVTTGRAWGDVEIYPDGTTSVTGGTTFYGTRAIATNDGIMVFGSAGSNENAFCLKFIKVGNTVTVTVLQRPDIAGGTRLEFNCVK